MTESKQMLCTAVLEDHFGYYVSEVGTALLGNQLPLPLIGKRMQGKMSFREVRRSMVILDQHNLLQFHSTLRGVLYSVLPADVIRLARAPRSILVIKTLFDGNAEAVFEEVLAQGRISCSDCIRRVCARLETLPVETAKERFVRLAEAQMIIRCPAVTNRDGGVPEYETSKDPFIMPDKILDGGTEQPTTEPGSRKRKLEQTKPDSDADVLWRVNWPRIERYLRDEFVLDVISENEIFDKTAIQVARLLLKVGETSTLLVASQSNPVSLQQVMKIARDNALDYSREEIDSKLVLLSKEASSVIRRVGDSGGGLYIIDYEMALEVMSMQNIESAIREKFDDRGVRIFRLLRQKGHLEEEQIEKKVMLSSKEAKEVSYALLDNDFITTRQIAKTNDFAPARTFYLYGVNVPQLLGSMIDFTSQALRNVIRRRMHEAKRYAALTERQIKMETIISNIEADANLDEESKKHQALEVESVYLTAADKAELAKHKRGQVALWKTEVQLERLLFLYHQYQAFHRSSSLQKQIAAKPKRRAKNLMEEFQ